MSGSIDLAPLAVVVTVLWLLTVVARAKSRHHLYPVLRRALLTAVVVAIVVFAWNLTWALL